MPKTGEAIDMAILTKIAEHVAKRGDFIDTVNEDDDPEFLHSHNAIRILDTIVIRSDFWSSSEFSRTFLVYNEHMDTLREMTEAEDELYRAFDDEYDFLDLDQTFDWKVEFIIGRNVDNSISRCDDGTQE